MSGFKELKVWNLSMDLVQKVYQDTNAFPSNETYGLVSQIRRSAVSIPSNIAEGSSRSYAKEFIQFLYIAQGSLSELDTQLIISTRLGFISNYETYEVSFKQIRSMISGLIKSLQSKQNAPNLSTSRPPNLSTNKKEI